MPAEIRAVIGKHLDAAAVKQREDIQGLNTELIATLTKAGVIFNRPDKQAFRAALKSAGFYAEWKDKFGAEPWGLLEKYTGTL